MSNTSKRNGLGTRRSFLKKSVATGLGVGAVALTKGAFASEKTDFDVIIVGAGIAGLTAAKLLVGWGYEVGVLEADREIGGRIKTDNSLGAAFDLGAAWVHGPDGNPISKLAQSVEANTYLTDDDSYRVFDASGSVVPKAKIARYYKDLQEIFGRVDAAFDNDQPLIDALKKVSPGIEKDEVLQWMLSAYTEFDTGGPLDKLSAYYFDEDEAFDGEDVVFSKGYAPILKPLAAGLDVRLNAQVDRIEYEKGEGAYVYVGDQRFESSFVICTVPLGILQQEKIEFEPALPKKLRSSIGKIGMGNVTKLALKFDAAFWPEDIQYFGLMNEKRGRWNYFLNYRTFSSQNILVGFCFGDYAKQVEGLDDTDMLADCMDAVRTMFGDQAPEPTKILPTRWSKNPFSGGAYSYSKVGVKPADFDGLGTPIEDVILLAGEHTTFKHHATTHGAYLSGIRAAQLIEEKLA